MAMEIEKAIEILGDAARGVATFNEAYKEAVSMGKTALTILAFRRGHYLDDASLHLLLGATRKTILMSELPLPPTQGKG